ncbi:DUF2514 domain-containing protein [Pseudomonas sp. P2758]|uniref:DUF2514 domain-containing protein n=1 Tax=Pseudomonas sp. P2758 TaxID=3409916 RepID=UPI003B5A710E
MVVPWKAVGAIALVLIGAGSAWQFQDWRYGKQLAEIGEAQALAVTESVNSARVEEQRRQSAVNKEAGDARVQNEAATVDAGNADAAGDRLHVEATKFAAAACSDPGIAQRGASAARAAMVLSDLLQRADQRAGELAVAYDRARIAGLTCERSYDSVRSVAR